MKKKEFKDYKSVKDRVEFLLRNVPQSLESDRMMVSIYWLNELKDRLSNLSAHDLLMMIGTSKVASGSTIVRERQELQKMDESLRPEHYAKKKKKEEPNYFIVRQRD